RHAINHYILKLVKGGFKVAVCDQVSKPVPGTVVKRKVTRVYTPGTLTDESMLDDRSASYIFAFWPGNDAWGLVFGELLTSQLFVTGLPKGDYRLLESELVRFLPDEILMPRVKLCEKYSKYFSSQGYPVSFAELGVRNLESNQLSLLSKSGLDGNWASDEWVQGFLHGHFEANILNTLKVRPELACGVGVLGKYLEKNNPNALENLHEIKFYNSEDYLILDAPTQKNLEIVKNTQDGSRRNSLLSVLDRACTSMGSRTVKKWVLRPLVSKKLIEQRQEIVEVFSGSATLLMRVSEILKGISDLERIVGRLALDRAVVADFLALKTSLKLIPDLLALTDKVKDLMMGKSLIKRMHHLPQVVELLEASISEDGGSSPIKDGFDFELDRLRKLVKNSHSAILELEKREIKKTGIDSLKVRYTDAFGYSIEVTNTHVKRVPEDYVHKQTLVGRRRYITEELKKLEVEILEARERIETVENTVFARVKSEVAEFSGELRETANALAVFDAVLSLARVAYDNGYVRPNFNENRKICIKDGRHPVVEQSCEFGKFIPNDVSLCDQESLWIITGPNMGGKSTFLRQVALIALMAQIGSFVPAKSASLPILDRIFTRIGSGDNLAAGKSTFLVEMEEAAIICRQATEKSLVILDEVGRGTSTFDGMALAQAIIEYIFENVKARCLFATHYHELTHLPEKFSGIANYFTQCHRAKGGITFLHKLARGSSEGSFGIEVAKLAHLPSKIVSRAREILKSMENSENVVIMPAQKLNIDVDVSELKRELDALYSSFSKIREVEPDDLTPRQAHEILREVKEALN
ncbi:DNA mismatch repair protein MutS, partial [Candidatus Dependentiae bacterium]